ncbi:hypothetical protein FA13DRAFT_1456565 [Coprinellus micaceus]|uniref:NACHT domain-containing protein n=1 Tax=Coprinellus micaceus TaxID=71717 RepID=A0A4Y7SN74_COPMI|nr:hypothetical protein FA13DRAFT_1456565 [Coprinellus micaceus]
MPSPFHAFRHKVGSLLPSRKTDRQKTSARHSNADRPRYVDDATFSGSGPPSTTTSYLTPAIRSMVDSDRQLDDEDRDRSRHANQPSSYLTCWYGGSKGEQRQDPRWTVSSGSASELSEGPPVTTLDEAQLSTGIPTGPTNHSYIKPPPPHSPGYPPIPPQPLSPHWEDHNSSSGRSLAPVVGTSYFPNARGFRVRNQHFTTNVARPKTLFEYLDAHIAHGAAHDSNERCDAPACHEETRVAIQEDIVSWIKRGDEGEAPRKIMWLSGPAGAGKSAIAGSVATACKEEGLLAASFFFSSFSPSPDRSSKRGLIATLAHHMSQSDALYPFKEHLLYAVERQPDIFRKNLMEQAERLILGPFRRLQHREGEATWPQVVIIDGLDEVIAAQHAEPTEQGIPRTSEDDQDEILNVLLVLAQSPVFPFRIFIASRPERNIADFFATSARDVTVDLFLDSRYNPDTDIRRFLEAKFAHIRRKAGIKKAWPAPGAVDHIVDVSSGQFIVPVTIIRWVESGLPQRQLDDVLQLARVAIKNPYAVLDALYFHILKRAHNPDDDPLLVVKWIHSIQSALIQDSPGVTPATFWRQFLEDEEGELCYRLAPITSLVYVPPPDDTKSPITIYHKSLTDFLSSPARCRDLYVDGKACNYFVANRILGVLKDKGPAVHLSSPTDLVAFLKTFFWLHLLGPSPGAGPHYAYLAVLSEGSRAELTSCDVSWWTTVSLSLLHEDGLGIPEKLGGNTAGTGYNEKWGPHTWLVRAMYWKIHGVFGVSGSQISGLGQLNRLSLVRRELFTRPAYNATRISRLQMSSSMCALEDRYLSQG